MDRRTDRLTALYVDAILDFCRANEHESAIIVLLEHGLSLETTLRILSTPLARRRNNADVPETSATA